MAQYPDNYTPPVSFAHINAAGTLQVKATGGAVLSLNINSYGTGSVPTVAIYNTTSLITGTLEVASIAIGAVLAPIKVDIGPSDIGLALNTGIAIVTTGTLDVTLGYR